MTKKSAAWLLTGSTVIWSSAYLFMKMGLESIGPFNIAALRFGIAFLLLGPTLIPRRKHLTRRFIGYSALLGLFIAVIVGLIATGLETTTSSNAGFLVGLTVIFVPVIESVIFRRRPEWRVAVGAILAMAGIGLLTLRGSFSVNPGDALCALAGFLYAVQVIITDRAVAGGADGYCLGVMQMGFGAVIGLAISCVAETPTLPQGGRAWFAVMALAVLCSAIGFVIPPIAQKYLSPSHAGLIFSIEPLACAVLGAIFLEERLTAAGYLGGAVLLLGVVLAQVEFKGKRAPEQAEPAECGEAGNGE